MIRRLLSGNGVVVALGILCGITSIRGSWLPLLALAGLGALWAMLRWPSLSTLLVYVGILLAERGVMNASILGLPITLSKLAVLLAVIVHLVQVGVLRRPLYEPTPVTAGAALVLLSMALSVVTSIVPSRGFEPIASVVMLVVMMHILYSMTPLDEIPWLLRGMTASTLVVILWTLFTQRNEEFFVTLDHAWMQRTSGAYGDPNAWGACLMVICPLLVGAMAHDDHWIGKALFVGILALFPLAVLQSMSRAALVGLLAVSPGLLAIIWPRRSLVLVAVGAGIFILPFVVNLQAALLRYQTLIDPTLESSLGHASLAERKALLAAGIAIIKEHWLRGVGVGMFPMYAAYTSGGQVWKVAHNTYVNIFAEQGLPGVATHAFFGLQAVRAAWATWVRPLDTRARAIGLGFLLGLVGYAVIAVTLNLVAFAMFWYTLALGMALGRLAEREFDRREQSVVVARQVTLQESAA